MRLTDSNLMEILGGNTMRFHFSKAEMIQDGEYPVADAEWNYKDTLHHNHVHAQQVFQTTFLTESDINVNIWYFNLFGLKIPLPVINYQAAGNSQVNVCPAFGFILIIVNTWSALPGNRSRVVTTYNVGSPLLLRPLHFILRVLARRNYHHLMEADLPMRNRRFALRRRGYTFANETGGHYDYKEADDKYHDYLTPPAQEPAPLRATFDPRDIQGSHLLGEEDLFGLRVEKRGMNLEFYPRTCSHEGASLDQVPCSEAKKLVCPWHGRVYSPLAEIQLDSPVRSVETKNHVIAWDGERVHVSVRAPAPRPRPEAQLSV